MANGKNSPVIGDNGLSIQKGDASKYARLLRELSSWEKPDRSNVHALEERFTQYLLFCEQNDMKIGNQLCYLALGISKDDAYNWENGRTMSNSHSEFIKKVKQICAGNREILMQDGKINPITGIFWQKNYDGLRDAQEIEVKTAGILAPTLSPEDIAKQIPQDIPVDVDWQDE